ncbi:flagellar assembly protein FliH [Anaerobacillus sp. MEB173]|uniref:flagellar assembly protein FliH n=1 Tax=Anaerobacillus sp. MEB173 TaxID=3383345 RepID=UPI003F8FEDE7
MSNIIKSSFAATSNQVEKKMIQLRRFSYPKDENDEVTNSSVNEQQNEDIFNKQIEIETLLSNAQKEAARLLKETEDECLLKRQQIEHEKVEFEQQMQVALQSAKEEGYQAGFNQGLEEGKQQYDQAIQEVHALIDSAKRNYIEEIEQAEPMMIELAMKVSKKITGYILAEHDETWLQVVKDAINEVREQDDIKIIVHPSMYDMTLRHKTELKTILNRMQNLMIYPDPSLDVYGCRIETPYGQIEASVTSQLSEIKKKLLEKLQEESDEHE